MTLIFLQQARSVQGKHSGTFTEGKKAAGKRKGAIARPSSSVVKVAATMLRPLARVKQAATENTSRSEVASPDLAKHCCLA